MTTFYTEDARYYSALELALADDPPPSHTPGQAEGEEGDVDENGGEHDPIRRKRPGQAEGDDLERDADRVPEED